MVFEEFDEELLARYGVQRETIDGDIMSMLRGLSHVQWVPVPAQLKARFSGPVHLQKKKKEIVFDACIEKRRSRR